MPVDPTSADRTSADCPSANPLAAGLPTSARNRRQLLRGLSALLPSAFFTPPGVAQLNPPAAAAPAAISTKTISSGERLPLVGLGSWITFNVGNDSVAREACTEVMRAFFAGSGRMIDCSPMYGSSQAVIGYGLSRLGALATPLFSADKVWTSSGARGPAQVEESRQHWRVRRLDLLQVHNLLGWQEHLPGLFAMKAAGRLRYVGITTSEGRRHREIEAVMRAHPLDFVQVSYNLLDREVEERILPLARERGIAVIANRPFREGALLRELARHQLPPWAAEIGVDGWAQFALKFIVSHPAITCAIPATSSVAHVRQNLGAARGAMPDAAMRARMATHVAAL